MTGKSRFRTQKKFTVNAIAPGGVKTDMYLEAARNYIPGSERWSDEQVDKASASFSPLQRMGYPVDIAKVVAFLASEDGGWINGQAEKGKNPLGAILIVHAGQFITISGRAAF